MKPALNNVHKINRKIIHNKIDGKTENQLKNLTLKLKSEKKKKKLSLKVKILLLKLKTLNPTKT